MPGLTTPDYPASLRRAYWDKKKGVLAKAAGRTGVGDAMDDAYHAYQAVDWKLLKMAFAGGILNKKDWTDTRDKAMSEVNGNLAKFSKALYAVRDKARDASKKYEKAKTIPKSDRKLADDVADEADKLGVSMNKNSVASQIEEGYRHVLEPFEDTVADMRKNLKSNVGKAKVAIASMVKDQTVGTFNSAVTKAARDITQSLGNVGPYLKAGYDAGINEAEATKLFKDMGEWANKNNYLDNDASVEDVKNEIKRFSAAVKRAEALTG